MSLKVLHYENLPFDHAPLKLNMSFSGIDISDVLERAEFLGVSDPLYGQRVRDTNCRKPIKINKVDTMKLVDSLSQAEQPELSNNVNVYAVNVTNV